MYWKTGLVNYKSPLPVLIVETLICKETAIGSSVTRVEFWSDIKSAKKLYCLEETNFMRYIQQITDAFSHYRWMIPPLFPVS